MSVEQMAQVWKLDLAPNKKIVLLAYADHADEHGNNVFPSLGRIAHKTGYSRDQVRRISKELKDDELMELVAPATHNRPAEYRLTLERGSRLQPLTPRGGGANDPSGVGAPVPPEPPLEPSGNTPSGQDEAEAPPAKQLRWEDAKTGEKQAYLIAYLHKRHVERGLDPPTERQKERLSGELRTHIQRGRSKADLLFALDHIVEAARRGQVLDFYQAISDADGKASGGRHLKVVEEPPRPQKRVIS